MKHIVAFAGSNSKHSINKQLVVYTTELLEATSTEILDLNDFDVPMYGVDLEAEMGIPENAKRFFEALQKSDGILVSLAEHNGAYTAVFKNLFDWMSRIETGIFQHKPMLLMATSPGGRGAASVLEIAANRFPRHNATVIATFSLPLFNDNFKEGKLIDVEKNNELQKKVNELLKHI